MGLRALSWLALGMCVGSACAAAITAQGPDDPVRSEFLQRVDAALADRSADRLAALADVERWRTAGHPDLARLSFWLPPAPITRVRDLSAGEVIYRDGENREWRLRLHKADAGGALTIVMPDRPCPPRMARPRSIDEPAGAASQAAPTVWTVLECWPLPR
jgi:hypothetical protein